MSTPVVADPEAMRAVAAGFGPVIGAIATIAADAERDDLLGVLDGATTSATALLDETAEELVLATGLLRSIADGTELADAMTFTSGWGAAIAAMSESARLHAELTESLSDADGLTPSDTADPDPADDHDPQFGHFGWMPLFGEGGPSPDDVDQGQVGDCWLLAAYGSLASVDPGRIESLITDHGDGTYTVHFADGDVTVDDELPYKIDTDGTVRLLYAGGAVGASTPLWPAIIEKAQAIKMGGDYDDIAGDHAETAFAAIGTDTFRWKLNPWLARDPSDDRVAEVIGAFIDADQPVTASSFGIFGMGGGHAWSVTGVEQRGEETWVTVRNPWGTDGFHDAGPGVGAVRYDGVIDFDDDDHALHVDLGDETDGVIHMRIDVFTANFRHLELAEAP